MSNNLIAEETEEMRKMPNILFPGSYEKMKKRKPKIERLADEDAVAHAMKNAIPAAHVRGISDSDMRHALKALAKECREVRHALKALAGVRK